MISANLYTPADLIILLALAIVAAMFAMNMIAMTRRYVCVNNDLNSKESQISQLNNALQELTNTFQSLQKEVDVRDLYDGETDRYLQAINAAKSGLDIEHLQTQFEITSSEAELIISMHGKKSVDDVVEETVI